MKFGVRQAEKHKQVTSKRDRAKNGLMAILRLELSLGLRLNLLANRVCTRMRWSLLGKVTKQITFEDRAIQPPAEHCMGLRLGLDWN